MIFFIKVFNFIEKKYYKPLIGLSNKKAFIRTLSERVQCRVIKV